MPAVTENLATAALTILALALTLVALRAWWHTRSGKILLLAVGFAFFLAKGILLSVGLFTVTDWGTLLVPSVVIDLAILAVFYLAVFRRGNA